MFWMRKKENNFPASICKISCQNTAVKTVSQILCNNSDHVSVGKYNPLQTVCIQDQARQNVSPDLDPNYLTL